MKEGMRIKWIVVLATAMCLLASLPAMAEETTPERWGEYKWDGRYQQDKVDASNQAIKNVVRASDLIGMDVHDMRGEEIAEVKDIVIDSDSGEIRYVALEYEGFLGLGDKLFAVPVEAFSYRTGPNGSDDPKLTLNISKEKLEGAEGFDEDQWPDFADEQFSRELDRRYGVDEYKKTGSRDKHAANSATTKN